MHSIAQTQKILDPDTHVLDRWMPATKHIQHAPSTETECDYLYGWITDTVIYAKKLTQKKVKTRDIPRNTEEEELMDWPGADLARIGPTARGVVGGEGSTDSRFKAGVVS